jgi:hypothetical protein
MAHLFAERSKDTFPSVPVVLMSSGDAESDKRHVLLKPLQIPLFSSVVGEFCFASKSRQEDRSKPAMSKTICN